MQELDFETWKENVERILKLVGNGWENYPIHQIDDCVLFEYFDTQLSPSEYVESEMESSGV